MPTNDERRKVAARLRNAEIENIGLFDYSAHLGEAIGECVRLVSGHPIFIERGLNRLADLIEPEPERTCGLRSRLTGWYCFECSACGGGMESGWAYCPKCGAKVVDE